MKGNSLKSKRGTHSPDTGGLNSTNAEVSEELSEDRLLDIRNLEVRFEDSEGTVYAVNGVNLSIERGRILGVVGESGCGKSVMSRSIMNILDAGGEVVGGQIYFQSWEHGWIDLAALPKEGPAIRRIRGKEIAMIFQEPLAALSPVHRVGNQIVEMITLHEKVSKQQARERALSLLGKVGIPDPNRTIDQYTFELSGGMRQRVMVAMALACQPRLLIADEPTTALDVTIQAQILELLRSLEEQFDMAIMIISHDMGVIAELADDVAVMYLGDVVERGTVRDVLKNPKHPYTHSLMRSIPRAEVDRSRRLETISGSVPDAHRIPSGCPFHLRCTHHMAGLCDLEKPELLEIESGHFAACHLYSASVGPADTNQRVVNEQ